MNYSVRYLNESGITQRSEFLPFDSDGAANDHAKVDLRSHFIVEVWKNDALISRTYRDDKPN